VTSTGELASRIGDEARGRHNIERLVSEVEFYTDDWRNGADRLLAYANGASDHARIELLQLVALWVALAGGQDASEEVVAHLAAARQCADAAGCPRCATELRLAAADALAHVGRQTESLQALAEWAHVQARPQARDRHVQGRIEALLQKPVAADLLEAAAREADERGFGLDALLTRIDLGAALAPCDRARAIGVLTAVVESAEKQGARPLAELAEKRLRALGVRTWKRGSGRGSPLTEREHAITRLIAAGASNPEIAQQLFLSRKTVERHVSNVLRKTGSRNRAELAAKVAELEVEGAHR
jgi:DNA-binding NarL/FixJ family response regulator